MNQLKIQTVLQYVEEHIGEFHQQRIARLNGLKLFDVLKKKNPYLFRTKNYQTPETIVRALADAFISSNEETIFGDWLEGLAIYINQKVYGGWKSGIRGIDLEFDKDRIRYIVTIKSGPNWANSGQLGKMRADFLTAIKTLRTSNSRLLVQAVNGCCYGRDNRPDKGAYFKYCGQTFWEFISGNSELYLDIIEPLGYRAHARNEEFTESYNAKISQFALTFAQEYCFESGQIDWNKLVKFNSSESSEPTRR